MTVPMNQPVDEDAAALARIANTAAQALDDATQPDVGYPGLTYPDDVAEVLDALARLAGRLQTTVAHLRRFLDEELDAGRLTGAGNSTAAAVSATRARLREAYASTGELAAQLSRVAAAVTETPRSTSAEPDPDRRRARAGLVGLRRRVGLHRHDHVGLLDDGRQPRPAAQPRQP